MHALSGCFLFTFSLPNWSCLFTAGTTLVFRPHCLSRQILYSKHENALKCIDSRTRLIFVCLHFIHRMKKCFYAQYRV